MVYRPIILINVTYLMKCFDYNYKFKIIRHNGWNIIINFQV